jgi:hypothetical protein
LLFAFVLLVLAVKMAGRQKTYTKAGAYDFFIFSSSSFSDFVYVDSLPTWRVGNFLANFPLLKKKTFCSRHLFF